MKAFIISILLFCMCLSGYAMEYNLNQESGSISVLNEAYKSGMYEVWNINTGKNQPITFTYNVDLETFNILDNVAIYNLDDYGNVSRLKDFYGQESGTISTTIPNGKAKVVFYSEPDTDLTGFTGFSMTFSVNNSIPLTDNIYVSGKVGIGSTAPEEKLQINGNVKVNGYMKGNGNGGALRIKASSGYIDIGSQFSSSADFKTDRDQYTFDKPIYATAGKFCAGNDSLCLQTYYGSRTIPYRAYTRMTILSNNGYVGIGTTTPQYLLDVKGTIRAAEVKVESVDNFPDFVFEKEYKLPALNEVNSFIQTNGHLPNIPSAKEVKENGMSLVEMQTKLLQKIEELTLYIIKQQQEIDALKQKNRELVFPLSDE